jgi:hypothetical protein
MENEMRPETKAKRKIEALERRRALIDHLIEFIRTHPNAVDGADLHPLANRTGLRYDYAVIRPLWDKEKKGVVLRLEKWLENWYEEYGDEGNDWMAIKKSRIVSEDVTGIPDEKLCEILDDIHCELIPEDCEEDEESKV